MWPLISSKAINAALKQRGNSNNGIQPGPAKGASKGKAARVSGPSLPATGTSAGTVNTAPLAAPGAAVGRRPNGSAMMPLHSGGGQPGSASASSMSVAGSVHPDQNRPGYDLFSKGEREKQAALHGEIYPKHDFRTACRAETKHFCSVRWLDDGRPTFKAGRRSLESDARRSTGEHMPISASSTFLFCENYCDMVHLARHITASLSPGQLEHSSIRVGQCLFYSTPSYSRRPSCELSQH